MRFEPGTFELLRDLLKNSLSYSPELTLIHQIYQVKSANVEYD